MGCFRGWKGLSEELTSAQGPEGNEATSHVNIRRKCVPSKENEAQQGPDVGRSLSCSRKSESHMAGRPEKARGRVVGGETASIACGHEFEVY